MIAIAKTNKQDKDYAAELQKDFDRWEHLRVFGGSDPFYADGANMNLVRNHILHGKLMIEQTMKPEQYPVIYHRETPPEAARDYMARAVEIRANAKKSLETYKANPDYTFLCKRINRLTEKQKSDSCIGSVIGYVSVLDEAIQKGDLLTMRRHEYAKNYLDSFSRCATHIRGLKPPENEQLNFFTNYSGYNDYGDDEDEWDCEF